MIIVFLNLTNGFKFKLGNVTVLYSRILYIILVVLPRMKISISTDISVLEFYGYIEYIGDISVDIFT